MSRYVDVEPLDVVGTNGVSKDYAEGMEYVLDLLDTLPIADVEPVRHGKWTKATDDGVWSYADVYAECDQCHKVIFNGWNMNFCPNCGTRMDGKRQEDANADKS